MKRTAGVLLAVCCLLAAADKHYWKAGKVLDSEAARTYFQTGSTSVSTVSGRVSSSGTSVIARQHGQLSRQCHCFSKRDPTDIYPQHGDPEHATFDLGDESAYVVEDSVEKAVGSALNGSLGRAIRNGKHGCRHVVNEWVSYSEEGGKLLVNDVDGKTCQLGIVRQELLRPEEILALENRINSPTAPEQKAPPPSAATSTSEISINSTPGSADITIDGKYMGGTPSIIRLPVGEHQVEIVTPGFKAWKRQMTVAAGGQITSDALLEKEIVSQ